MMFDNAFWIWTNQKPEREEYVLFRRNFVYTGGGAILNLAAETDYVARVNGQRVGFGSFAGWRDEKYYDTLDISSACRPGENLLEITVRYEGVNSLTHIDDGAGLIYALVADGQTIAVSDTATRAAYETRYVQHQPKHITGQLGLTSGMIHADPPEESAFAPAAVQKRTARLAPRPVLRMNEEKFVAGQPLDVAGRRIYDLGAETAGYLRFSIRCDSACKVKVAYGEHLADGCVRYLIGGRDFSFDFVCTEGENRFEQFFVRAAARYLEVFAPETCEVTCVGLIPVLYPVTEIPRRFAGEDQRIYDTCVRTLRLCMHTHYEDCAWREQALYVLDSRNQMLCGYDAFAESSFQRANLIFISKGLRPDGMLELTYPAVYTPAIPFFSVMYPIEVSEYVEHTGDVSIIPSVIGTIRSIMTTLASYLGDNGLIRNLPPPYWNFYEWSPGSDGHGELGNAAERQERCDLILNCAYLLSAAAVRKLCDAAGLEAPEMPDATIRDAIPRTFFDEKTGIFRSSTVCPVATRLCNAFALLAGFGDERTVRALAEDDGLVPETLSMAGFVYDALLAAHPQGRELVLNDIRKKYGYMLSCGATSFWETIEGEKAFRNAGSLCHGWSAIPIVYLCRFAEIRS